jgi:hypothetical protein
MVDGMLDNSRVACDFDQSRIIRITAALSLHAGDPLVTLQE